jgi:hypothetical protein
MAKKSSQKGAQITLLVTESFISLLDQRLFVETSCLSSSTYVD